MTDNKEVFRELKNRFRTREEYNNKYLAIVDGMLKGVGDNKIELEKQIHEQFGTVDMYIGNMSDEELYEQDESVKKNRWYVIVYNKITKTKFQEKMN